MCTSPSDYATISFVAQLRTTGSGATYDIGLWIAEDGGNALTGTCSVTNLPSAPVHPWTDADGDSCGDMSPGNSPMYSPVQSINVSCADYDHNGMLDVNMCLSWHDAQDNVVCTSPTQTVCSASGSCSCQQLSGVAVAVPGQLAVVKTNDADMDDIYSHAEALPASAAFPYTVTYKLQISYNGSQPGLISSILDDKVASLTTPVSKLLSCASVIGQEISNMSVVLCFYDATFPVAEASAVINTVNVTVQSGALTLFAVDQSIVSFAAVSTTPVNSPCISVIKSPPEQTVLVGGTAVFTITVLNVRPFTLTNVHTTDALSPGCNSNIGTLPPFEAVLYTCSQSGVAANFTNIIFATGTSPTGNNVTANATAIVNVTGSPSVLICKMPSSQNVAPGTNATFSIVVFNTGDMTLTNVSASDALTPSCNRSGATLSPGESFSYSCQANNIVSSFTNEVIAEGWIGGGLSVNATAYAEVVVATPSLIVTTSCGPPVVVGASVTISVLVVNSGQVALDSVSTFCVLAPACARNFGRLEIGASYSFECSLFNFTGSFVNEINVVGHLSSGDSVSVTESCPVVVVNPAVAFSKSCPSSSLLPVGSAVTFTVNVANTGDVPLSNIVITDTWPQCSRTIATLGPSQTQSYTCVLALNSSMVVVGTLSGTATAGRAVMAASSCVLTVIQNIDERCAALYTTPVASTTTVPSMTTTIPTTTTTSTTAPSPRTTTPPSMTTIPTTTTGTTTSSTTSTTTLTTTTPPTTTTLATTTTTSTTTTPTTTTPPTTTTLATTTTTSTTTTPTTTTSPGTTAPVCPPCGSIPGVLDVSFLANGLLFFFADGSVDANWQSASKGYLGNVIVDGIKAQERTSGSFAYAGILSTNDVSLGAWQAIVNNNAHQATAQFQQTSLVSQGEAQLAAAFAAINNLTATKGYEGFSASQLDGINTQNNIAEVIVINIVSGFNGIQNQLHVRGDASDVFILRWDTDLTTPGYQGAVKFQSGGAVVPQGGLAPGNFINVAGDMTASGGGSNPPAPYPQGPRFANGTMIANGADFGGGGFFTGYWLTTGDPSSRTTQPMSNAVFVGGWYTTTTQFSLTSGCSGVHVSPFCLPCSSTTTAPPSTTTIPATTAPAGRTTALTTTTSPGTTAPVCPPCGSIPGVLDVSFLANGLLFFFADGSVDANWQSASKGYLGNVIVDGIKAQERTSGSFAYAGILSTNDVSLGAWQAIVNNNAHQATAQFQQTSLVSQGEAQLAAAFAAINNLTATKGYEGFSASQLDGINTQNNIAEVIVVNIVSGFNGIQNQLHVRGDASDVFILRWDTDLTTPGYQGAVKFQSGGAVVPQGGLAPGNFINVAGDMTASGGGSNPPAPYPQGPRFANGTMIANGADFGGGGFFTGYWLTTGDPSSRTTQPMSNAVFVGGWYTTTTQFSLTSGCSGVHVSPFCLPCQ